MTRTPEESLREAQTHFALMRQHAEGDLTDQLVIDAICMRLSAGVEALARLDTPTRERLFGDTWPLMRGMRNRIAHGYLLGIPKVMSGVVKSCQRQGAAKLESALRDDRDHRAAWCTA